MGVPGTNGGTNMDDLSREGLIRSRKSVWGLSALFCEVRFDFFFSAILLVAKRATKLRSRNDVQPTSDLARWTETVEIAHAGVVRRKRANGFPAHCPPESRLKSKEAAVSRASRALYRKLGAIC